MDETGETILEVPHEEHESPSQLLCVSSLLCQQAVRLREMRTGDGGSYDLMLSARRRLAELQREIRQEQRNMNSLVFDGHEAIVRRARLR
jgi:hypothetical protein